MQKNGKVGFEIKKFFLDSMSVTEMTTKMKIAYFTTMHRGSFKIAH